MVFNYTKSGTLAINYFSYLRTDCGGKNLDKKPCGIIVVVDNFELYIQVLSIDNKQH